MEKANAHNAPTYKTALNPDEKFECDQNADGSHQKNITQQGRLFPENRTSGKSDH